VRDPELSWAAMSTGGTPHEVVCPWCEGSGHRIAGIDAQEHPAEGGERAPETASEPDDT